MLVGALPVVDYFAFVLENLSNSAIHLVSGRSAPAVVPIPGDSALNEERVVKRFSCCDTVIHEVINQFRVH